MAGYIGSRIAGIQVDGYTQSEADAEFVNDPNAVITVSGSNVGIGRTPSQLLDLEATSGLSVRFYNSGTFKAGMQVADGSGQMIGTSAADDLAIRSQSNMLFSTGGNTERMRIDSSGNLLVGKTSSSFGATGIELKADNQFRVTRSGVCASLNRLSTDGVIADFYGPSGLAGAIGTTTGDIWIGTGDTGLRFHDASDMVYPINPTTGTGRDNAIDLGEAVNRFDDIYATNGTIQTSDRNEKQDIEALSDAEQRVAVAAKGLLRKYRWKDAVAEKGDAARIHFGIIAQDLQAAFEAEGLDAGRYAMFISSTWWEAERVIPAVEAQDAVYETQTDEDGNEVQVLVSEAVEAQPERTVIDTFNTQDEAPVNATERTRLGVRYPELLAFIIAAL